MKKKMKLLSLAAALCGAVACSSGGGGGTTGGPGTTGSTAGANGSSTGAHASGTAAGSGTGSASGGTGSGPGGSSTGGSSTGTPPPSLYPCVDGGPSYMPTNPPDSLPFCWCNPGDAGTLSYYQIINSCPPSGSSPNLSIPAVGAEDITGLAGADLPLQVDAGVPGFVGP